MRSDRNFLERCALGALCLLAACGSDPAELIDDGGTTLADDSSGRDGDGGGDGDGSAVDATTLARKHMTGYQGWHFTPTDGSPFARWRHWFDNNTPTVSNLHIDFWPETSEIPASDLFATDINDRPLYSAYRAATVDVHFAWMAQHHLDGVFLQRFLNEAIRPDGRGSRDQVARNVKSAAAQHGRVFALMYDISGAPEGALVDDLKNDWRHLIADLDLVGSDRYLRHDGKPVVAIWGLGFSDRPGNVQQAEQIIAWFKSGQDNPVHVTLVGGVPTAWRTLGGGSKSDPGWAEVYRSFDIVSPWSVGRYSSNGSADSFKRNLIAPDLTDIGPDRYMPVIWPGYTFHNASDGARPLNQIPRRRGDFYWHQAINAIDAGCTILYTAMYDEVDEGTAIYKQIATADQLPSAAREKLVHLNFDEPDHSNPLKTDWYLKLADEISKVLRGEREASPTMPTPY
jgi:hypothetical protein